MSKNKPEYKISDLVIDDEYGIIDSEATVQETAQKMKELGIPDLVVLEKDTQKVLGVIADFDIVQDVVADGKDPATIKATQAMYKIPPVTKDTLVVDAFTLMRDLQVNVVPVVEGEKLLGVCSIQDCWSYIPDENVDEIGLIPVTNPRNAEFWFASICSLLALLFGVLLPLSGVYGYYRLTPKDAGQLFGYANLQGGPVVFYLFEAHGTDIFRNFAMLAARHGFIWVLAIIWGFIVLILGVIGLFSIIYTSLSEVRYITTGATVQKLLPLCTIGALVLEWVILGIAIGANTVPGAITVDPLGIIFSILAILLIIAALLRDILFKQSPVAKARAQTGSD